MNKNKLLNIMVLTSNFFQIMIILTLTAVTIGIVYWHIDREVYSYIPIQVLGGTASVKFTQVTSAIAGTSITKTVATLNNISTSSLYLLYMQLMVVGILILLVLREFTQVIRSVKRIQTFVYQNIRSFKKIGLHLFMVFLLSGVQYSIFNESRLLGVYVHLTPLLLALLSYTLSEVFREGNALLEENSGTI